MAFEGGYTSAVNSATRRRLEDAHTDELLQQIAQAGWLQQQQQKQAEQKKQQDVKAFEGLQQLSQPPQPGAQGPPPQPMAPGQPSQPMMQPPPGPPQGSPPQPPAAPPQGLLKAGIPPQGAAGAPAPPSPWKPSPAAPPALGGGPPPPMGGQGGAGPIGSPPMTPTQDPVLPPQLQTMEQAIKVIDRMKLPEEQRMPVLEAMSQMMDKQNKAKLEQYKIEEEVKAKAVAAAKAAREEAETRLFGGIKPTPEMVNAYFATGNMDKARQMAGDIEKRKGEPHQTTVNLGGGLSEDAKRLAAEQYLRSGQLPAMYRDQKGRAEIMDLAAKIEKERGGDLSDVPADRATFKADAASLTQRQRFVDAGNQFIKNMSAQADLVEKYMKPGAAGAPPVFNKWIQSGRKQVAGDPDVTALDTALRGLAREHQRIVTGVTSNAQLHVAAQQTADELLNIAQTPGQMKAAIKVMREEAENAVKAGKDEVAEIRGRMKGGKGAEAPPSPPTDAVAHLKAHPDLKQAFDEKYGPGAAARALGQ